MAETKSKSPDKLYLGAQNDILYIIDKPPRPSNDQLFHERSDVNVIAKIYKGYDDIARRMVEAYNGI